MYRCQVLVSENATNVEKCMIKPSETQCLKQTFQDSLNSKLYLLYNIGRL